MRYYLLCDSTDTLVEKNGTEHWYKFLDGYQCKNCYKKYLRELSRDRNLGELLYNLPF
jgi:transposase-like protein